ncbi:MAG: GNAT family N-acetyltransferase [Holophaga sp.]|nr:GNAT family N-acetyltransferase [Holophaga sp.]
MTISGSENGNGEAVPWHCRPLHVGDQAVLEEMLYLALWHPAHLPPFPEEIVRRPELYCYVSSWGECQDDIGFLAVHDPFTPLGAIWIRRMSPPGGYGFWDAATPELAMAVVPGSRNQGIGTRLLAAIIAAAQGRHPALSLSVAPENPAVRLYRRFGFVEKVVKSDSMIMVLPLDGPPPE